MGRMYAPILLARRYLFEQSFELVLLLGWPLSEDEPSDVLSESPAEPAAPSSLNLPDTYRTSMSTQLSRSRSLSAHRTWRAALVFDALRASMMRNACRYSLSSSVSRRSTGFCWRPICAPVIGIEPRWVPPR